MAAFFALKPAFDSHHHRTKFVFNSAVTAAENWLNAVRHFGGSQFLAQEIRASIVENPKNERELAFSSKRELSSASSRAMQLTAWTFDRPWVFASSRRVGLTVSRPYAARVTEEGCFGSSLYCPHACVRSVAQRQRPVIKAS